MRQKYKGKDVIDRLHNTVIRYKSHPYLCTVDSSGVICLNDLTNGNLCHKVSAEDEDLDISSINIGYVNIADPDYRMAVYLKREPARRFKQGIEFERLTQKTLKVGVSVVSPSKLGGRGFVDAVLGNFPSLQKALNDITKNGWASVALSRDVALMRDKELLKVYLKDDEVGFMRLGTTEVMVPKTELSWYHAFLLEGIKEWKVVEGIK
jgi:hypothetical protein